MNHIRNTVHLGGTSMEHYSSLSADVEAEYDAFWEKYSEYLEK